MVVAVLSAVFAGGSLYSLAELAGSGTAANQPMVNELGTLLIGSICWFVFGAFGFVGDNRAKSYAWAFAGPFLMGLAKPIALFALAISLATAKYYRTKVHQPLSSTAA